MKSTYEYGEEDELPGNNDEGLDEDSQGWDDEEEDYNSMIVFD